MGQLTLTTAEIQDMLNRNMTPFRQDVTGSNSISIAVADTQYLFANNGATRNAVSSPAYMTDRWDTTNYKMTAVAEYDHPTYVGDIGFIWTPDASSEGHYHIRVYIDESGTRNFATDPLIRTYTGTYKGAAAEPRNTIATWYWGDETGYDAKNNGIYFTVEFEHTGDITSPSTVIYNTQ